MCCQRFRPPASTQSRLNSSWLRDGTSRDLCLHKDTLTHGKDKVALSRTRPRLPAPSENLRDDIVQELESRITAGDCVGFTHLVGSTPARFAQASLTSAKRGPPAGFGSDTPAPKKNTMSSVASIHRNLTGATADSQEPIANREPWQPQQGSPLRTPKAVPRGMRASRRQQDSGWIPPETLTVEHSASPVIQHVSPVIRARFHASPYVPELRVT